MTVIPCDLEGVLVIEPRVFGDARGYFLETWNERRYREAGIPGPFVQDNLSFSRRSTLRGLHFQNPAAQGKLVYVLAGEVFDVVVDLRRRSPTFGRWYGARLSSENKRQMYIPPGFAHGFAVMSDTALFAYKCTEFYAPEHEVTLLWNDPDLAIDWPVQEPVLSEKDRRGLRLRDLPLEKLFP
ncbi:MAG: dTDP-4-dehydrorhamnose 3,5-epimerase [Verrucomicrobiota bacterium]|nr:dTDP-4-dehydrorhamnose 3,5-epimerase [Limisphaera sp.]MDW8380988.1 dTDP-4-dehydrorhamnose 3,5-epimerase [Verrucomicrobiota bacterium]